MKLFNKSLVAILIGLCTALTLSFIGCSSENEEPEVREDVPHAESVTFIDSLGNEVTVEDPKRVVACMGSFADMWRLAGGSLVGASSDTFDTYDVDPAQVASVGDFSSPDLEQIMACDPDFVIMTSAAKGRGGVNAQVAMRDALEAADITTAYFEVTTFEDYLSTFKTFCDITGCADRYKEYGEDVNQHIQDILKENALPEGSDVKVAVLATFSQGTRIQNSSSMTGDMLKGFNVVNIADENPSLLKDYSLESLIEANPDIIYICPMGNDAQAAEANLQAATTDNPAWSTLDAVNNDHVVILDPDYFMYKPNEKWATSYQILADSLKDFQ